MMLLMFVSLALFSREQRVGEQGARGFSGRARELGCQGVPHSVVKVLAGGLVWPMVHQETLFVNGENLRYILGNGAGFGITALNALRQLDCCFGYLGMKGTIHAG